MNKVIKYLGHPLHTVAAKERDRQRIAEAMAKFGHVEPAKDFEQTPTPAERRVASWKKDACSSKTSLFTA